ncbi:hypothetical protein AUR67_17420 [Pseudoalteromonas sp. XI10]|uniref:hypothetical protein n=1 Tax=Pseudoalteromonas sp. XI10 TaxID=1766621 RepID=UPI00073398ED|nr:hypothetical protein [Pseudoalteromonas sp. XI10]KTG18934.1 hypothetical protein AUR67_17420 [Pseudoalteromonas sp. XI10]
MATKTISYPYPVLGNRDDILSSDIDFDLETEAIDNRLVLKIPQLNVEHPELKELLEVESAAWLIRIRCSRTYFRVVDLISKSSWSKTLDSSNLEGEVVIDVSIIATKDISDYYPTGMNEDYGNQRFDIENCSVLALGPSFKIQIDKQFDPLKAPMASFIKIKCGEFNSGPFNIILEDDLIEVELSKQDWSEYSGIKDRAYNVLHSSLILPILSEAISKIDDYSDSLWSSRLKALIDEQQLEIEYPLHTAQKLLRNPISRTFKSLNSFLDNLER